MAKQTAELCIKKREQETSPTLRQRAIELTTKGKNPQEVAIDLKAEFPLISLVEARFIALGAEKLLRKK